jgi:hypothetical protein
MLSGNGAAATFVPRLSRFTESVTLFYTEAFEETTATVVKAHPSQAADCGILSLRWRPYRKVRKRNEGSSGEREGNRICGSSCVRRIHRNGIESRFGCSIGKLVET